MYKGGLIIVRRKKCQKCGCFHVTVIQAKIFDNGTKIQYMTKWVCIECFLKLVNAYDVLTKKGKKELAENRKFE